MKLMRELIVSIFLVVFLSGCTGFLDEITRQPGPKIGYYSNLEGLSKEAVARKFGQPTSKEISFSFKHRTDHWNYRLAEERGMKITFTDGYVSEVSYD
ncbi:MAG: hypothetical protein K9L86_03300 [Candidatus Omnitrophica bacterium]|nr:hypothetical protein [Candidatus Omnitrophota bacterium]